MVCKGPPLNLPGHFVLNASSFTILLLKIPNDSPRGHCYAKSTQTSMVVLALTTHTFPFASAHLVLSPSEGTCSSLSGLSLASLTQSRADRGHGSQAQKSTGTHPVTGQVCVCLSHSDTKSCDPVFPELSSG